jgi:hypothetical protein
MKIAYILALVGLLAYFTWSAFAQDPTASTVTMTVAITGSANPNDIRAFRHKVNLENERRAALTPPGTPLPVSPAAVLRTSYATLLSADIQSGHSVVIDQANRAIEQELTQQELGQVRAAIRDRLLAGESKASIISDVQTP